MEKLINIVTLNGFLSSKTELNEKLKIESLTTKVVQVAICDEEQFNQISNFGGQDYLDSLVLYIEKKVARPRVGLGYSLGGRILLQLIEKNSNLFDSLVFISVHPGFRLTQERKDRFESDLIWKKKLENMSLTEFINEWNSQPVLSLSQNRDCKLNFTTSSDHLAKVLINFSLAYQADFRSLIQALPLPQLWVSGSNDIKFKNLHQELAGAKLRHLVVDGAGHRIHFDRPAELMTEIQNFLTKAVNL